MEYILTHCNASFAIVGDQEQVDKIYEISGSLKGFKDIVYVDPKGLRKYDKEKLHDFASVLKSGEEDKGNFPVSWKAEQRKLMEILLVFFGYTSGTTGKSKGVGSNAQGNNRCFYGCSRF